MWKDDIYEAVNDPAERPFIRNNSRLQGEFHINEQFRAELNATDIPYLHPFKDTVYLEDIYTYPDLKEFIPIAVLDTTKSKGPSRPKSWDARNRGRAPAEEAPQSTRRVIKGREIIDYIIRKRKVVITAPDRAGKTAFARTLFKDLWRNGTMPLLVAGDKIDAQVSKTFGKYLDQCFNHQYAGPKAAKYWQMPVDGRAIIIDDYHKLPNVRVVRERLLEECSGRFGTIILLGGPSLRFQELAASDAEAGLLSDFSNCEMLGFGNKLRSQIIRRWFVMNRLGELSDADVDREIAKLEALISIVLGRDLLPHFPTYILLFLQQLELRQPIDVRAASYGKLYEAFLVARLAKRHLDVETAFSYLGELAYAFFKTKIDQFDEPAMIQWHNKYVQDYANPIEFAATRNALIQAGFLVHKNGVLRFRVKADFFFFVAHHIASHLELPEMRELVSQLAGKLYREDAANIVLFLCHLARDPFVLREVIATANKTFAETPETDLYDDIKFTGDLVARLDVPILTHGDPEKRRQDMLEAQDDASGDDDATDEMYAYRHEEETEQESDARRQVAQLNGSFKTIQILGQIARSFAGSLKGDEKRELTEACFALGLRVLRFGFDAFKMGKESFGKSLQRRMKRLHPDLTEAETAMLANSVVFMFVNMYTYGVIRHIAGSIGVEKLAMTFKELRDAKNTVAVRTLDAAIQLEHFTDLPEKVVIDLYDEVKDVLLMQDIVRHLAWDRLYYFRCPHDIRQRICSRLGIKTDAAMLDTDHKKS